MKFVSCFSEAHELRLARDDTSYETWHSYISDRFAELDEVSDAAFFHVLFRRATKALPKHYALRKLYVGWCTRLHAKREISSDALETIHREALKDLGAYVSCHASYLSFLVATGRLGSVRRALNDALESVSITQHDVLWRFVMYGATCPSAIVCEVARTIGQTVSTTSPPARSFLLDEEYPIELVELLGSRCTSFDPSYTTAYAEILLERNCIGPAAAQLEQVYLSAQSGKYALFSALVRLLVQHPIECDPYVNVERVLRDGFSSFREISLGSQYGSLAEYFVRKGEFPEALTAYKDGLDAVKTVADFVPLFDGLVRFLFALASVDSEDSKSTSTNVELLESYLRRRAVLLNAVKLRKNKKNVKTWRKRISLLRDLHTTTSTASASGSERGTTKTALSDQGANEIIATFGAGVDAVAGVKNAHELWCDFATFYEEFEDLENARSVFLKATEVDFSSAHELAEIVCASAHFELRVDQPRNALRILSTYASLKPPDDDENVGRRFVSSDSSLWNLYLDVEEHVGTVSTTCAAYESCISRKIASTSTVLNYAAFLVEKNEFAKAFRAFEVGLTHFTNPHALELWIPYLAHYSKRNSSSKPESVRALFERAIQKGRFIPSSPTSKKSKKETNTQKSYEKNLLTLWRSYASFELHVPASSPQRVDDVYTRGIEALAENDDLVHALCVDWITTLKTGTSLEASRVAFETAVDRLKSPKHVVDVLVRWIDVEVELAQLTRARALYVHASGVVDPSSTSGKNLYKRWSEFELEHGSEHTFKDMLRVKRSAQSHFDVASGKRHVGLEGVGRRSARVDEEDTTNSRNDKVGKLLGLTEDEFRDEDDFGKKKRAARQDTLLETITKRQRKS